ncbi:MAG: ATP synthase F1 subunit delta [Christensenellales bacterium]|jgi:F-type H+-transporting ATPase subunit delta
MAELKDRYAAALYELSVEAGALDAHVEQAQFMLDALSAGDCADFLSHPHIPDDAKRSLLHTLFAGKIADSFLGFLHLAIEKSREGIILPTLTAYLARAKRAQGRLPARVVSAAPLTEDQLRALTDVLSRKLKKKVELAPRVDPALIGGFYVHVDGRLIDRTVRTQLYNLKESLMKGGAV